jgi:hypothetical protein
MFKKIIPDYNENQKKSINKNADLLIVKSSGTYSYLTNRSLEHNVSTFSTFKKLV